jgi:superoxide dismutase, Fe-Mn family
MITRRTAIKNTALIATAAAVMPVALAQDKPPVPVTPPPFTLPPLPYAYDALEPHIDARTMEIHHDRHHAGYVANLNKAVAELPAGDRIDLDGLLKDLKNVPENIRTAVRNNGGGHYNHSLFWQMMKKGGGESPDDLTKVLEASFGSMAGFKTKFNESAMKLFGSGWTWLVLDGEQLKIESTANQDTPLSSNRIPLLGLDVWEHAYYLKFQNKRADYITAWWNVVNWDFVASRFPKF